MRIAFDFDGTITKNPFIFKELIESLSKNNELYIISGTSIQDKDNLLYELKTFNIDYKIFKEIICKNVSGSVQEVSEWKYNVIDTYKIRLYFENRDETANQITSLCNVLKIL